MSYVLPEQDLDLTFLYEIADGSTEFIIESIDMFLEHTPELLKTISGGIADGNWPVAAGAAHKLKPNCGFFGMPISQAKIQEVELMAKTGNPDSNEIKNKFNDVKAIIENNLTTLVKIKGEL